MSGGPLGSVKVVEFASLGPGPFCAMLLSDLGAEVVRIDRPGSTIPTTVTSRGRCDLPLDLKQPAAVSACLDIIAAADVVLEGFRPGVMERLGLGPEPALERNPSLVYGRMTGWGQDGPLAATAGHDINYIALTGALHAIGPEGRPTPPLNLVGDFGGGALYLAFGVVSALLHARATGAGQVVDAAITDGAASLMAMPYGYLAAGRWSDRREANRLDGAAPYYRCYPCQDGLWLAVGCLEPQFYRVFAEGVGLDAAEFADREDPGCWPTLAERIGALLAQRPRSHWLERFEGTDACVTPVLSMQEAPADAHNRARGTFVEADGVIQPAPAPRFSLTPGAVQPSTHDTKEVRRRLSAWGLPESALAGILD